ncbi:hypothetical protein B0H19DRAFT_1079140 [Mycena capillaripes]|nr:hypothetical protein B0H19DRAFT_1079140 [Mycena capillaripes]
MSRTRTPTLSTHSIRNPARAVQPTRKRSKKTDHVSKATAALKAAQDLQTRVHFHTDVDAFYDYKNTLKTTLAKKYNRNPAYINKLLSNGTQYATTRKVSMRNAIMHDLSLKAKDAGEASDLKTLRNNLSPEGYEEIRDSMSDAELKRVTKQLEEHRKLKHRGIRATNKAAAADAMQNANRIGDVLIDSYERAGVRGIALFMRGHPDDPSVPYIVDSDETRSFFQAVLGCSVFDVLRKLELWSCTRDKAIKNTNSRDGVQKEVAELLTTGLRKIKNNKTLAMAYSNYREEIVHKLGVELAGWPETIRMRRPSKMSAADARSIRDKLRSGEICWVRLTRAQRDAVAEEIDRLRAEGMLKQCKERSDKGLARGPRDNGDEDEESGSDKSDSDEEEHSDDDDDSEEAPTRTRTQVSRVPTNIPFTTVPTDGGASMSSIADLVNAMPNSTYPALIGHNTAVGAALAPFDPDALDFNNINWGLAPPLANFDWLNADLNSATHAADLALAALQPHLYAGNAGDLAPPALQPHAVVASNPHAAKVLTTLPALDAISAVIPHLSYPSDAEEFPPTLSAGHANSGTNGPSGTAAPVFAVSTNTVHSAQKRPSGEDLDGASAPKRSRMSSGDQGSNGGGSGHVDANTVPKQRKKRSDAGVKRKSTASNSADARATSASADAPAASASADAPVKQRKKRSDAGVKRGPRT